MGTLTARDILKRGFIIFVIVGVIGYVLFQTKELRRGPIITLTSPQDGEILKDPLVVVRGTAQNSSYITLNDRQIFVNPEGEFEEELLVYPGYTEISIKVQDRFQRFREKRIGITLENDPLPQKAELIAKRGDEREETIASPLLPVAETDILESVETPEQEAETAAPLNTSIE